MSDRKPNWDKWKLIPNARIWQVAALSLDIDPDNVKRHPQEWMASGFMTLEGKDFSDRLEIIAANANNDTNNLLYLVTLSQNGKEYCQINIANFAKWAISNNVSLPPELGALASKKDSAIKQVADKPLSDKERESMIKIIHALAKNGYKYPNHGALAEIIRDFEINNNGVAENTLTKYLKEFDSL